MKKYLVITLSLILLFSIFFVQTKNTVLAIPPDEGPYHWNHMENNLMLWWWTPYTGVGSRSYDLVLDEEYYYTGFYEQKLTYHQVFANYVEPTYPYVVDIRIANVYSNYYGGDNIGSVPFSGWSTPYKYDYIFGNLGIEGGANYSTFYTDPHDYAYLTNNTSAYAYAEGGWMSLDTTSVQYIIN